MENLIQLIRAREIMREMGQDTSGIDTTIDKLKNKVLVSPMAKIKELADAELNGFVDEVKILYSFKPEGQSTIEIFKAAAPKTNPNPNPGPGTKPNPIQTKLRVTFADGTIFADEKAADICTKAILKMGRDRCLKAVEALDLKLGPFPLICNQLPNNYDRTKKELGDGWWLLLDFKNEVKKQRIEQIANYLGEKVKVEVYLPNKDVPSTKSPVEKTEKTRHKGPQLGLKVTFPDGKVINRPHAVDTYCETIMQIGIDRVFETMIEHEVQLNGINIITDVRHPKYGQSQRGLAHGWWLSTYSNTLQKKDVLEKLSHYLGLGLTVEKYQKPANPASSAGLFEEN